MRINPEVLNKLARDTAAQRANADRSIVSIYLLGSLLTDEPLLGNTADIDLVCVHSGETPIERTLEIPFPEEDGSSPEIERMWATKRVDRTLHEVGDRARSTLDSATSGLFERFGVPTRDEVHRLIDRVERLNAKLARMGTHA